MYDAINENPDAPNITWPDETEDKAIIEFHACKLKIWNKFFEESPLWIIETINNLIRNSN